MTKRVRSEVACHYQLGLLDEGGGHREHASQKLIDMQREECSLIAVYEHCIPSYSWRGHGGWLPMPGLRDGCTRSNASSGAWRSARISLIRRSFDSSCMTTTATCSSPTRSRIVS